jgi:hypothetical protein
MATQLFLRSTASSAHRGTNSAKLNGATSGWTPRALATTRGATLVASGSTPTVAGTTLGIEVTDGTIPMEWLSEPVSADVTISGTITANIWAAETDMTANVAINVVIDIVRSDSSNTIVNIVKSTRVTECAITNRTVNNFTTGMASGGYTAQTLNRGDRLRIRVFGDDAGTMGAGFTFYIGFSGPTAAADGDSYVTFTENITFESPPGAAITQDASDSQQGVGETNFTELAQTFVAPGSIARVELYLEKVGSPTDNVLVSIQTVSGSDPTGTVLASTQIDGSTLSTTAALVSFLLPAGLTQSTTYAIVVSRSGAASALNFYRWSYSNASVYADGTGKRKDGGSWEGIGSGSAGDYRFLVYQATTIYLTDVAASDVVVGPVAREAWTSRGSGVVNDVTNTQAGFTSPIQVTDTAGGTSVQWFTKQLQAVTLTGMAVANIRAQAPGAANASIRLEIARVASDGTSPTVWASWCMSANNGRLGELNTSEAAETVNVSGDDLAISDGQRLRIRLYIDDYPLAAMGASQTVTNYYGGTTAGASGDTYITFPVTLTEYTASTPDMARFGESHMESWSPRQRVLERRRW